MDYKFSNLLGAPYRGGDLLLHGTTLLSPTGNRVSQVRHIPSAAGVVCSRAP
jgi:periodic tryptophan protein 2